MTEDDLRIELESARDRVCQMDAIDGIADRHPQTILAALKAGLLRPETGGQFDAFVMLADLAKRGPVP